MISFGGLLEECLPCYNFVLSCLAFVCNLNSSGLCDIICQTDHNCSQRRPLSLISNQVWLPSLSVSHHRVRFVLTDRNLSFKFSNLFNFSLRLQSSNLLEIEDYLLIHLSLKLTITPMVTENIQFLHSLTLWITAHSLYDI